MNLDENERDERLAARFARAAQDFADQQHEMAGRDVGRIARFLNAEARDARVAGTRGTAKKDDLTTLQMILAGNKALAEAYRETERKLRETQNRLDEALERVIEAREAATDRLLGDLSAKERTEEETRLEALEALEADIRAGQLETGAMQEAMDDPDNADFDTYERFRERADALADGIEKQLSDWNIGAKADFTPDANKSIPTAVEIPKLP